jgi:hypothetical protein
VKIIPVLTDFDHAKPIGAMVVDETLLPLGAGYHFALGYKAQSFDERGRAVGVELVSVAAVPDEKFSPEVDPFWVIEAREVWAGLIRLREWAAKLGLNYDGLDEAIAIFDARIPPLPRQSVTRGEVETFLSEYRDQVWGAAESGDVAYDEAGEKLAEAFLARFDTPPTQPEPPGGRVDA